MKAIITDFRKSGRHSPLYTKLANDSEFGQGFGHAAEVVNEVFQALGFDPYPHFTTGKIAPPDCKFWGALKVRNVGPASMSPRLRQEIGFLKNI